MNAVFDFDGDELGLRLLVSGLIGAVIGALPLVIGLIRGHRSMSWLGFGFCIVLGLACPLLSLVPALIFTIVVATTEPIEKKTTNKRRRRPEHRRRDRADDFLDDASERRRRESRKESGSRHRRHRYEDDDDD